MVRSHLRVRLHLHCVLLPAILCEVHSRECTLYNDGRLTYDSPGCRFLVLARTVTFLLAGASTKELYEVWMCHAACA